MPSHTELFRIKKYILIGKSLSVKGDHRACLHKLLRWYANNPLLNQGTLALGKNLDSHVQLNHRTQAN